MTEHYNDSGPGNHDANIADVIVDVRRQEAMLKIGALLRRPTLLRVLHWHALTCRRSS
jgi:hypothetical protein